MSAFIVSKETMDLAVMAIFNSDSANQLWRSGYGVGEVFNSTLLGRRLYEMNLAAVTQRYPADDKNSAPGPCDISDIHGNYVFTDPSDRDTDDMDWYHAVREGGDPLKIALECLSYQCAEGDVPDTWPEYEQIDRIIAAS